MNKLSCSSCGSTDTTIKNKYYICNHCNSSYLLPKNKTKLELLLNINIKYSILISLIILTLSVTLYKYYISQNFTKTTSYIQEEYFQKNVYYKTGELKEDRRSIDRTHSGTTNEYRKDGNLRGEWIYQEGLIIMGKRFYKTGELNYNFRYKDGEAHGLRKEYYKSGELKSDTPFVHGRKDGIEINYLKNGSVDYRVRYKDNKIVEHLKKDEL